MPGTFLALYKYQLSESLLQPYEVTYKAQRGKTICPGYQPVSGNLGTNLRQSGSEVHPSKPSSAAKGHGARQTQSGVKGQGRGGAGESDRWGQKPGILHSAVVFVKDTPDRVILLYKNCSYFSVFLFSLPILTISYYFCDFSHTYISPVSLFN